MILKKHNRHIILMDNMTIVLLCKFITVLYFRLGSWCYNQKNNSPKNSGRWKSGTLVFIGLQLTKCCESVPSAHL